MESTFFRGFVFEGMPLYEKCTGLFIKKFYNNREHF